jgi:F-type H+-transporting ATPase subunit c
MRFTPGTDLGKFSLSLSLPHQNNQELHMETDAAALIGAGLAAIGMGAAAIGVGTIFGNFLSGALRNPSAADSQFGRAFIGAALAEGLGIFAFVVALILLFVKS